MISSYSSARNCHSRWLDTCYTHPLFVDETWATPRMTALFVCRAYVFAIVRPLSNAVTELEVHISTGHGRNSAVHFVESNTMVIVYNNDNLISANAGRGNAHISIPAASSLPLCGDGSFRCTRPPEHTVPDIAHEVQRPHGVFLLSDRVITNTKILPLERIKSRKDGRLQESWRYRRCPTVEWTTDADVSTAELLSFLPLCEGRRCIFSELPRNTSIATAQQRCSGGTKLQA